MPSLGIFAIGYLVFGSLYVHNDLKALSLKLKIENTEFRLKELRDDFERHIKYSERKLNY